MSRCGVIGDVHAEDQTLARVIDALNALRVDPILCVGDLVDGMGDADQTLATLRNRNVVCVAGNHERWLLAGEQRQVENATKSVTDESRAFLESLPRLRHFSTPSGGLLLCHGVGVDDEAWLTPETRGYALQDIPTLRDLIMDDDVQFMVGGHTHQRMVRRFAGLTVINVGTIHRKFEQTFAVIDFENMRVEVRSADPDRTGDLVEELVLPPPAELS